MENGEKLIVGVTSTMVSLVIRLLVNLQRNGAKGKKEKADGSQRSSATMQNAKFKNAAMNTNKPHAARKASDHAARVSDHAARVSDHAARVSDHAARVSDHTARVSDHTARVSDHAARVSDHTARVSDHTAKA